jgi:hypothetical protein
MHLAISAVLVGCTASAFDAIPHGMEIPGMIPSLLYKMRTRPGCKECLSHGFIFCSHLWITRLTKVDKQCSVVSWFLPASDQRDPDTGMWTVKPEGTRMRRPVQVIPLKSIARGAHLLPKYGVGILPDYITHINALDEFQTYFVNPYIDHHCHEFLSE